MVIYINVVNVMAYFSPWVRARVAGVIAIQPQMLLYFITPCHNAAACTADGSGTAHPQVLSIVRLGSKLDVAPLASASHRFAPCADHVSEKAFCCMGLEKTSLESSATPDVRY